MLLEKPYCHEGSVGIKNKTEYEIRHIQKIYDQCKCYEEADENRQILLMHSSGRQGSRIEQTAVQFIVLEIICDPKPEKEAEYGKTCDDLLDSETE